MASVPSQLTTTSQAVDRPGLGDVHLDSASPEPPTPRSLADLGYESRTYPRKDHTELWSFIRQPGGDDYIAIFMIHTQGPGSADTLYVNFVDMGTDCREGHTRPRLRQLLAVFWTGPIIDRHLRSLRRIVFRNVTERYTRAAVRDNLCPMVGIGYDAAGDRPCEEIVLDAPIRGGAIEPWEALCENSRLVRSVAGLLRDYPAGKTLRGEWSMTAEQMRVSPACDEAGRAHCFDLEIQMSFLVCER